MVDCNIFIYIVLFYCFIIKVGYEWYVVYFVISYLLWCKVRLLCYK